MELINLASQELIEQTNLVFLHSKTNRVTVKRPMHILHSIDIPFFPKQIIARTKQNIQLVETYNLRIRYA